MSLSNSEVVVKHTNNNLEDDDKDLDIPSPLRLCCIQWNSNTTLGLHLSRAPWDPYPWISDVHPGSTAFEAGIRSGDCVLEVNGEDILGKRIIEVADKIKQNSKSGENGVTLLLWNSGTEHDFKNIVNKPNESGIIIFSFGTNLRTEMIDDEKIELFIEAFRQLTNYTVIMKYNARRIHNIPPNVKVFDYIPQDTLLSYSRVKMLITNGGRLSLQEASWHGIPIIGVPLYHDQHQNVRKSVADGFGIELDINNLSVEKILDAIKEVRANFNYKKVATARSAVLNPGFATPVDFARYWVEYVMFNLGDTPHFYNPAINMSFFTVYGLDVLCSIGAFVICYIIVIVYHFRSAKKVPPKKQIVKENITTIIAMTKDSAKSKSKKNSKKIN